MQDLIAIEALRDKASDEVMNPTQNRRGMTYEEGVRAALEWVLGETEEDEGPLD